MFRKILFSLAVISAAAFTQAQQLNCQATAVPALIRAEGVTERVGDIVLTCTGGAPGTVQAGLTLFATSLITNRVSSTGVTDVQVQIDTASGPQLLNTTATAGGSNSVNIANINLTVPATGQLSFRITNLRVNAFQAAEQPIKVQLASNGPTAIRVDANPLTVGLPSRSLYSAFASTYICSGSQIPDTLTFSNLIAKGTRFASIRVTEGPLLGNAFEKRTANADSGTRIAIRYSGFPAGARLFVPDVVAGANATVPTAGGDLGFPANGGSYTPSAQGSLLLSRVRGNDANGASGTPAYTPGAVGSGTVNFNGVSEVALSGGAGIAVYEVVDANNSVRESAQFPTFLSYTAPNDGSSATGRVDVSLAPISTDSAASPTAPVPRFQPITPLSDCQTLGDCNSGIFPILSVNSDSLNVTAFTNSAPQTRYVRINNDGGSLLNWTATVNYQGTATGWLTIDPTSGFNNATVRLDFSPGRLSPGTYNATLVIDAGPIAGQKSAPITFTVNAFSPPPPVQPIVSSVVNGASFASGPVSSGSLVSIFGSSFGTSIPSVIFDTVDATVLYASPTQLNVRVPDLGARTAAQLVILTSDARRSNPITVTLMPSAPGIFTPGVLNQDNTINSPTNPAPAGSVIQVYATGLALTNVTAKLGVETIANPRYAGAAPGFPGLQQVNLDIPSSMAVSSADLSLCSGTVCSPAVKVSIKPAP